MCCGVWSVEWREQGVCGVCSGCGVRVGVSSVSIGISHGPKKKTLA